MIHKKMTNKEERREYEKIGKIVEQTFKEVSDFVKQKSASENQQRKYSLT